MPITHGAALQLNAVIVDEDRAEAHRSAPAMDDRSDTEVRPDRLEAAEISTIPK